MEFIFNKNAGHYYKSSKKLFLPVEIIDSIEGFFFQLGKKNYFFRGFITPLNNSCSESLAQNKYCANKVLEGGGIPVPKAAAIHIDTFKLGLMDEIMADLTFPLVVKPTFGALGIDVVCNITDMDQLTIELTRLFSTNDLLTLEEFHGNMNSYRILVLNKKIIGVIQRYPARVLGDGQHTITELIASMNIERQQSGDELAPIVIDNECHIRLRKLGITPEYIPKQQELVILCYTSNASRGGTYQALSSKMCKQNRQLFIKTVSLLNLNIAGIDVECVDLDTPITHHSDGVIIEVNPNPSIRIHENPQYGKPTRVTGKVIRSIIYRHPGSYFYVLYKNKNTAPYIRSLMALPLLIALYLFVKVIV